MMNKLSNEDLPANADSVSQSTDDYKTNNSNGELEVKYIFAYYDIWKDSTRVFFLVVSRL